MTITGVEHALDLLRELGYPSAHVAVPCPDKSSAMSGAQELRALGFVITVMSMTSRREWWLLIDGVPATV